MEFLRDLLGNAATKTIVDFKQVLVSFVPIIRDYLSVIIVVPAILGGAWQLYALLTISTSFIKFFSISQVVPDGILVFLYIICLLILIVVYSFLHFFAFEMIKLFGHNSLVKRAIYSFRTVRFFNSAIFLILYSIMPLWLMGTIMIKYRLLNKGEVQNNMDFFFYELLRWPAILATYFLILNLYSALMPDGRRQYFRQFKPSLYFVLSIMVAWLLLIEFKSTQLFPATWVNLQDYELLLNRKFPDKKIKVLYMNDLYLFTEIKSKSKDTLDMLLVTRVEELFDTFELKSDKVEKHQLRKIEY